MSNHSTQYDEIAEGYSKATYRRFKWYVYWWKLVEMMNDDLRGKKALDLGCGEGISTRLCQQLGASLAVGIDPSSALISKAASYCPPGSNTQYMIGYAEKLRVDQWKPFDLVLAAMLLNYAETAEQLGDFCQTAARALKDGGVFIGTVPNPVIATNYDAYGVKMKAESPAEGSPIHVTLSELDGTEYCQFVCYHWSRASYEQALCEAGFSVEWVQPTVHEKAISAFSAGFWDDYLAHPTHNFFIAQKQ